MEWNIEDYRIDGNSKKMCIISLVNNAFGVAGDINYPPQQQFAIDMFSSAKYLYDGLTEDEKKSFGEGFVEMLDSHIHECVENIRNSCGC